MSTIQGSFRDCTFTVTDDAAHSAALPLSQGDYVLTYDAQGGYEVVVGETLGAVTGLRKGKRKIGTLAFSAKLADPGAAFQQLVTGRTSGFTSVTADLGDVAAVDWTLSFAYGAQARSYYGQDMVCTEINITVGDIITISYKADLYGPISSTDTTNGVVTIHGAR